MKNFILKYKVTIGALVLMAALGVSYWALGNPGPTTIGEDVTVGGQLCLGGVCKSSWPPSGGGWYVPSDVEVTTVAYNGNFGGYQGMYNWIQINGCAGYHVCSGPELAAYIQVYGVAGIPNYESWFSNGLTIDIGGSKISTECIGWTTNDPSFSAATWGRSHPTFGSMPNCAQNFRVMCCK